MHCCEGNRRRQREYSSVTTSSLAYHFHITELPDQNFSLLCKHARYTVLVKYSTQNVLLGPLWENKHIKLIICLNLHLQKLDTVMNIHRSMYTRHPTLYTCIAVSHKMLMWNLSDGKRQKNDASDPQRLGWALQNIWRVRKRLHVWLKIRSIFGLFCRILRLLRS
jgi:hypothetical protein